MPPLPTALAGDTRGTARQTDNGTGEKTNQ